MKISTSFFSAIMIFNLSLTPFFINAKEGDTAVVEVKGEIFVQPPCHINNDKDIKYEFGQVVVSDVGTDKAKISHDLKFVCDYSPTAQLFLTVTSPNVIPSITNAIAVNDSGLGIAFFNASYNDTDVDINAPIKITDGTIMSLTAQLINYKPGSELKTGTFSASAILETSFP